MYSLFRFIKIVARRFLRLRLFRHASASLQGRILLANLAGLVVMIGGIFYLSHYQEWLVESKKESLRTQGELIAAAISSNARIEQGNLEINIEEPKQNLTSNSISPDNSFAALQLSMHPERVSPILKRLIQHTKNRARIYGLDGTMIIDSATFLSKGQITGVQVNFKQEKTKNFWTRTTSFLIEKQLPVYKEIGNAKGTLYPEIRLALQGKTSPLMLLDDKGNQIVSMALPIKRNDAILGALLLSMRPGDIEKSLNNERNRFLTLGLIALVATILSSFLLARTVAEPIRKLADAANQVSRDINSRKNLPEFSERKDEVGQLAKAFLAMTKALYHRIEASESFAADVAHELKNPLTAARSTAESLVYAKSPQQRDELVRQIQNELKRLNRLISDVSNASKLDAELARQTMSPTNISAVVEGVARIFQDIILEDGRSIEIKFDPSIVPENLKVSGHEGRLTQVITNLVDNAISFSPPKGVVTLHVHQTPHHIEIFIDDEGPGIPEDRLSMIFDRFYTDRPQSESLRGKNSGLGLSISREIILAHNGEIWAENRRGDKNKPLGARFIVRLPKLPTKIRGGLNVGWRN
ncbi:MAG: stimulus-sensing domain-containing protein [Hyphomicrobium sp.]